MATDPGKKVRSGEEEILATKTIATLPNRDGSDAWCFVDFPEFTAKDYAKGFPEFATVWFFYRPGELLADLRSLKYYVLSYRERYSSQERAFNRIFDRFVADVAPLELAMLMIFNRRGNMGTYYVRRTSAHLDPVVESLITSLIANRNR